MAKQGRNFLNLEVKRFIVKEREKNKSLTQISQAVYQKFQVKAPKSVVHRLCQKRHRFSCDGKFNKKIKSNEKVYLASLIFQGNFRVIQLVFSPYRSSTCKIIF